MMAAVFDGGIDTAIRKIWRAQLTDGVVTSGRLPGEPE
jgi:hypothetical protein